MRIDRANTLHYHYLVTLEENHVKPDDRSKLPVYIFVFFVGVVVGYGFYTKVIPQWEEQKKVEKTQVKKTPFKKEIDDEWLGPKIGR